MTAQQAIDFLRECVSERDCDLNPYTLTEIADLIERLQACQACERQSNQFFSKCEHCEGAKE